MSFTEQQGDLFASGLPALAHGVNCEGVMGAGIATEFRKRWPAMYGAYRAMCDKRLYPGLRPGDVMTWAEGSATVFNLATQDRPGADATIEALAGSTVRMVRTAEALDVPAIGMPRIGCGIGGLQWDFVREWLDALGKGTKVRLIAFTYEPGQP